MKRATMKRKPLARKRSSGAKQPTGSSPTSSTIPTDLWIDLGKAGILVPALLTHEDIEQAREAIRRLLIRGRKTGGSYLCDGCGQAVDFLDMHEIVNRNRTQIGSLTRLLSYQKELVALLCRNCHEQAHGPAQRAILFCKNYERYGEARVRLIFALLLRSTLSGYIEGIQLP